MKCDCHWCRDGKPHPAKHTRWYPVTHILMKAESLDANDSIKRLACWTCGHTKAVV